MEVKAVLYIQIFCKIKIIVIITLAISSPIKSL